MTRRQKLQKLEQEIQELKIDITLIGYLRRKSNANNREATTIKA